MPMGRLFFLHNLITLSNNYIHKLEITTAPEHNHTHRMNNIITQWPWIFLLHNYIQGLNIRVRSRDRITAHVSGFPVAAGSMSGKYSQTYKISPSLSLLLTHLTLPHYHTLVTPSFLSLPPSLSKNGILPIIVRLGWSPRCYLTRRAEGRWRGEQNRYCQVKVITYLLVIWPDIENRKMVRRTYKLLWGWGDHLVVILPEGLKGDGEENRIGTVRLRW